MESNYQVFSDNPISAASQILANSGNELPRHSVPNLNIRPTPYGSTNKQAMDLLSKPFNGQVALQQIQEAASNIERLENNRSIKETLADAIRIQGRKEKTLRESTISFNNAGIDTKDISGWIDEEWVHKLKQAPVTYWNDKQFLNCQFINIEAKQNYLASGLNSKPLLAEKMVPMNSMGEYFKRRPVRMVINNVRQAVNTDRVIEIIKNCTDFDTQITEVKDGKPNPVTKARSIFFRINGHGLMILVDMLDGEIPYSDKNSHVKTRLRVKVNCKPWQCRDCFAIGVHECEGKKCRNCANKSHITKDCNSSLKYCGNCRKRGHRSTDVHCPTYLNEIAKEIRKMDIPIRMLEEKELRLGLAKCVQLK